MALSADTILTGSVYNKIYTKIYTASGIKIGRLKRLFLWADRPGFFWISSHFLAQIDRQLLLFHAPFKKTVCLSIFDACRRPFTPMNVKTGTFPNNNLIIAWKCQRRVTMMLSSFAIIENTIAAQTQPQIVGMLPIAYHIWHMRSSWKVEVVVWNWT